MVAVAAMVASPWTTSDAAVAAAPAKLAKHVVVASATATQAGRELRFSGVVRAKRKSQLSFVVGGRMLTRAVEVGDRVAEGGLIATLDRRAARNRISRAKAGVRQASERLAQGERDHGRARRLAADEAASEVELEGASHAVSLYTASRDAAAVELSEAQRMHRDGTLRAPFAGTVVEVTAEQGEFMAAGQSVVTLSGDALEVEIQVPETVLSDVEVGAVATLELPLQGGRALEGTIVSRGHGGQGAGRLFPVVISLPADETLVPGMTADFVLSGLEARGVKVPVSSVIDAGKGETTVFVVKDGVVDRKRVEVAQLVGSDALVVEGLVEGDRVVSGGHFGLVPGQQVETAR